MLRGSCHRAVSCLLLQMAEELTVQGKKLELIQAHPRFEFWKHIEVSNHIYGLLLVRFWPKKRVIHDPYKKAAKAQPIIPIFTSSVPEWFRGDPEWWHSIRGKSFLGGDRYCGKMLPEEIREVRCIPMIVEWYLAYDDVSGPHMVVVNPDDGWFVEQAVLKEKKSPDPGGWSSEDYEDDYHNDCFVDGSFDDFGY